MARTCGKITFEEVISNLPKMFPVDSTKRLSMTVEKRQVKKKVCGGSELCKKSRKEKRRKMTGSCGGLELQKSGRKNEGMMGKFAGNA